MAGEHNFSAREERLRRLHRGLTFGGSSGAFVGLALLIPYGRLRTGPAVQSIRWLQKQGNS